MMAAAVSGSVHADAATDADDAAVTIAAGSKRHLLLRGRYFSSQVHTCFRTGSVRHSDPTLRFGHSSASSLDHHLPWERSY